MKLNIFKPDSPLYDLRWLIIGLIGISVYMAWNDFSGGRIFTWSNQQTWSNSGPGSHK
jgi:hypothetical protein